MRVQKKKTRASSWFQGKVHFFENLIFNHFDESHWHFHQIGPLGRFDLVVAMSVCVSACLMSFSCGIFWGLFCPHFPKSDVKIFRDSESLGKSAGKKWSQNWPLLLGCGLKSPRKKKVFFLRILPHKTWWKPRFLMD